ncbi:helix-turn-helix transcriptional regulator [Kineosporia mesophila]|uniref:helix-turn-helix domain-containing protein n=1 Tax=Kineosporia mesophila TaxID=566012 RepID=UPI001E366E1F|nr:helix-turn-helix transcriptional regulator [Kineosporia mesophila]MCD5351322.1 helix-turn-helix transcriptional regulator [Kineosporia mesophila]
MPRHDRPLRPDGSPLINFAADLRRLREKAGKPSYRELAREAHYSSTTLSDAAGGRRLPTLPVVRAYVRACQGDVPEWERRWRALAAAHHESHCTAPHPGSKALQPEHADRFFGRDALLQGAIERLTENRFLAVVGASGVGKSSLLLAGVTARLRAEGLAGRPAVAVEVMTPGARPAQEFGSRLARHDSPGDLVVVIDQFEEVFTRCQDEHERAAFVEAVTEDTGPRVVIGLRADFLARCAAPPALGNWICRSQIRVGGLGPDELRQVVTGPPERVGCTVEESLVTTVVADYCGRAGALPVLSQVLLETWRRRVTETLTLADYESAGGAFARSAEVVYRSMDERRRQITRGLFLRMTRLGEGIPDSVRCLWRDELDGADPETQAVLEILVGARLVTVDEHTVQPAHESLITTWPRLRDWLQHDRDDLRVHRNLTEAAHSWKSLAQDPGALLRGVQLTTTREWAVRDGHDLRTTPAEQDFLTQSVEAERQDRAEGSRRERQVRLMAAGLVALLVALAGVTLVAVGQWRDEDGAQGPAISRRPVSASRPLALSRPDIAVPDTLSGRCLG